MKSRVIHLGLAIAALLAAPIAAQAADLGPAPGYSSPSYKAPAYVAPSYGTWSGFYIGLNGGYGFGSTDWDNGVSIDPKGWLAGGTVGYNLQTGAWVWGIEGDFDWANIKGDTGCAPGGASCSFENNWFATARGRIGYAGWGGFMPYITGGAAFAGVKANNDAFGGDSSSTRIGWTIGGGLEYAFLGAWSVKLEYLYADLGHFDCGNCGGGGTDIKYTTNLVRAGVNYRF